MQVVIPTESPESWKRLLAKPSHWKPGFSAMALAQCWEHYSKTGAPPEVEQALGPMEYLLGIPEYKVDLPPKGGRPSQTDLLVMCRDPNGLVILSVEGKVNETFGPTLGERRADPSPGVAERISWLLRRLGLSPGTPETIRYQLLHRSAAAIGAAENFAARRAVMLIHSFSQISPHGAWFEDFVAFAALFGVAAQPGQVARVGTFGGMPLDLVWCRGDERFLEDVNHN